MQTSNKTKRQLYMAQIRVWLLTMTWNPSHSHTNPTPQVPSRKTIYAFVQYLLSIMQMGTYSMLFSPTYLHANEMVLVQWD